MPADFDVIIVGAGVVGCAVAERLARGGRSVAVLDAAAREGTGVTSRNSGVLHAGLYDPPGSLRARACVRGHGLLLAWCARHLVPHRITGKLVVAHDAAGEEHLQALADNARACGVDGPSLITADATRRLEPALAPVRAALASPHTGIVDAHALTSSLRAAAEGHGALFVLPARVERSKPGPSAQTLHTSRGPVRAAWVVNAAGLHADRLARQVAPTAPGIHPCRGDYFRLRGPSPVSRPVYPVRRPGQVGLGLHLTVDLSGAARLGPDAEFVDARDDFAPAPHKHGRFLAAARRLLGPVPAEAITYDTCGIRPKLRAPGDPAERDFLLLAEPAGWLHLLGIESPGLTAALALAEEVAARLTL